jgi:hypothetical protein
MNRFGIGESPRHFDIIVGHCDTRNIDESAILVAYYSSKKNYQHLHYCAEGKAPPLSSSEIEPNTEICIEIFGAQPGLRFTGRVSRHKARESNIIEPNQ